MSNKEIEEDDLALSRGKEDFIFVHTELPDVENSKNPKRKLKEIMERRGLEWENCQVIGIFRDEFSLRLEEGSEVNLRGKRIYPEE